MVDEKTENSPLLQKAFLSLSELKSERIGPRVCVKGDGTNVSESTLGYVKVFVVLFSKNGEVFDFASGDIQSTRIMRSGDTFSFSRCVEDEKGEIDEKKYEIHFEGKIGSDYKNTEITYVMK